MPAQSFINGIGQDFAYHAWQIVGHVFDSGPGFAQGPIEIRSIEHQQPEISDRNTTHHSLGVLNECPLCKVCHITSLLEDWLLPLAHWRVSPPNIRPTKAESQFLPLE